MSMAERIKAKRLELGLTQEELASRLGLQKSAIAKYENGRVKNIKRSTIAKLAEMFQCDPSWLMSLEDSYTEETREKLFAIAEESVIIGMYRDLDAGRKAQADSYIRYLHNEWSTENRTADVVSIKQREKDHLIPNAAHEDNPTPEQKKHADDIMNDDSLWS